MRPALCGRDSRSPLIGVCLIQQEREHRKKLTAYIQAFSILERRITLMLSLPLSRLDSMSLNKELDNIGKK